MLMWYIIFGLLIVFTVAGIIYISTRLVRFSFMNKLSPGHTKYRYIISFIFVAGIFSLSSFIFNLLNSVVCLLYFVFFWILSDFLFLIIQYLRKRSFKYYYAGITAVILSLISLVGGWYLAQHVWATSYIITTEKDIENLRIIEFADSHIGTTFDDQGFMEHIQEMQKYNPDMVFIVGDFVDDGTTREQMIAACQALGTLKTTYGVYFVLGNHDEGYFDPKLRGFTVNELIEELRKNNINVLQDEAVLVNNMVYIIGRKDSSENQRGRVRATMKDLIKELNKDKFVIVLDHQPNDYKNQSEAKVDLVLSGHTHGGQLYPLNKVGEWIGANDKTYGYERRLHTDFIVTSGLSDWEINFKTGTKSEFVIIDIQKK